MELNTLYNIEISPKDIFDSMKTNIYNNFSLYSFSIISKEYLALRSDLFALIKKISDKMGFKSQTYFLSIYYLDILFTQNKKADCNYNVMGLACLLLASKYCENDPAVPELKYFIRIYNKIVGSKNSISVSDLFYSEVMTCKMLNHKLNYYTVYDFNSFFFNNNILRREQLIDLYSGYDIGHDMKSSIKARKILEKIYKKSRYYLDNLLKSSISLKYNSLLLSVYIMKKSIENTLINERHYEKYNFLSKDKFLKKTNDYFNSIIVGYYGLDYENMPEFQKLIEENDFIKIFNQTKRLSDEFSPTNKSKPNNPSISHNKTPNKTIDAKSLNLKISDINFSSTKKNFNKLKTSHSIHTKMNSMNSTNSLLTFSGQNMPRVSYIQSHNLNQKALCRNLGVDNCNENYRQKEKDINNIDKNQLLFLFRLNSQNSLSHNLKYGDKKNELINMYATSPLKFGISDKNIIYNNYQNKKEHFLKKTKTSNFEKNNFSSSNEFIIKSSNDNKSIEKDILVQNINGNNNNINVNLNVKPYYKKLAQNYNKLKNNFNQISNKFNSENNDFLSSNDQMQEKNEIKYNIVNRMPKYKLSNYIKDKEKEKEKEKQKKKEEISCDRKSKINLNIAAKRFTISNSKDINLSNIKKEYKGRSDFSNNKEKKISKLLHINLNAKHSDSNITPLNAISNKNNDDYFFTTTYINKSNTKKKKYETRTVKPINNLARSIDNKSSTLQANLNQKKNFYISKRSIGSNMRFKDIQIKKNNNNFRDNKKINYLYDSNEYAESIFSNTLTSSNQGGRYSLMTIKKEKEKEKDKNSNNKIFLTDNTLSGDERNNNFDGEVNEFLFNTNTFKSQMSNKYKRIFVKKNKYENEYHLVDKEKNKNKNSSNQHLGHCKLLSFQNNDFKNYEESNDEDSNSLSQKNYLLYSFKNKNIDEDNTYSQHLKKNPSTIVINNNININFGMKDKKRYKNIIKNSQIQINNNNGPNSIASLLNKIPLCYKNNTDNEENINKII